MTVIWILAGTGMAYQALKTYKAAQALHNTLKGMNK